MTTVAVESDERDVARRLLVRNGVSCSQVVRCYSAGDLGAESIDDCWYETVLYVDPTGQTWRALINASVVMECRKGW